MLSISISLCLYCLFSMMNYNVLLNLFFGPVPWWELHNGIPYVGLSAIWTELEIIVLERLMDLSHKGLRHKKRAAPAAWFQLYGPDLLLSEDLGKPPGAELVSQFSSVFWTGLNARAATDALIMGVFEYAKVSNIIGFKRARGAAQYAGCAASTFSHIHPCPYKEKNNSEYH